MSPFGSSPTQSSLVCLDALLRLQGPRSVSKPPFFTLVPPNSSALQKDVFRVLSRTPQHSCSTLALFWLYFLGLFRALLSCSLLFRTPSFSPWPPDDICTLLKSPSEFLFVICEASGVSQAPSGLLCSLCRALAKHPLCPRALF